MRSTTRNFRSRRRWLMLAAIFVMQTCLGGLYGWSVFVPVLKRQFDFTGAQSQIVFGLTIASFTLAMIAAGRLLSRWGARWTAFIGGILFAVGYAIAARSGGQLWGLILGIGIISGSAIGFGYVAALKSGMLWFPAHRGLVTGVAVAGFGGGAILLSQGAAALLQADVSLMRIFTWISGGYGIAICLCSLLFFEPPEGSQVPVPQPSLRRLLCDQRFWLLGVGIFSGTFAGLLIVGNLKPFGLAHGVSEKTAILAISFFAFGNALGRLSWGYVFDKIGYRAVPANLLLSMIVIPSMFMFRTHVGAYLAMAILVGIAFGGCFVLYAAEVSRVYGVEGVNFVYPILFLLYGLSALAGPAVGGWFYDQTGGFGPAVVLCLVMLLSATLLTWMQRHRMVLAEAVLAEEM